jgi:hypothetical protein
VSDPGIERLVQAIDEHPDPLHGDRTPAVDALVARGVAALPYIFPLLEDAGELTRLHAQRVLEGVSLAWVRERTPARPLTRDDTRAWQALWDSNGSYDWRAAEPARREAVTLWRGWLSRETGR